MCGIIGVVSEDRNIAAMLYNGLKRLEYRGYDSCGIAVMGKNLKKVEVKKGTGNIDDVDKKLGLSSMAGVIGIAHTRWATTGKVTKENAHPHFNSAKTIFAVHNGIIENYDKIKSFLVKKGFSFVSETDTEIIPHYFDYYLRQGFSVEETIKRFMNDVKGTFAILLMIKGHGRIYALKRDSPLVLGIGKDSFILASDIYAFSNSTNQAIFFDDDEFAVVSAKDYRFFSKDGARIDKSISVVDWHEPEQEKAFEHFMLKEIKEQPSTSKRLIASFSTTQKSRLEDFSAIIKSSRDIVFCASGTSYHAALLASILFNRLGYPTRAIIASEAESFISFNEETLLIAVSQSGETMDLVEVVKKAKNSGSKVLSIVNVPYSTIQRLSDMSIEILAGQEICVAATKTYTNQLILLAKLAEMLGFEISLDKIPGKIQKTIEMNEGQIKKMAEKLYTKNDIFVLGKSFCYPVAREIALKLKEISYIHAEGMMAGELKHGTIALIEQGTPVISLIPDSSPDVISATHEVKARGADAIIISDTKQISPDFLIPQSSEPEFAIYSGIIGHLLSYYIALKRGLPIDKPRNLAKSVTVK